MDSWSELKKQLFNQVYWKLYLSKSAFSKPTGREIAGPKYTYQANWSLVNNIHKDSKTVALKHYIKHNKY